VVERRDPSKETTSLHSTNRKAIGLSTSPIKVAMQAMDATSCQLDVTSNVEYCP